MSNLVDVVDVSSDETSRDPPMHQPREGHAAAASLTSLFVFGSDEIKKNRVRFSIFRRSSKSSIANNLMATQL